MRSDNSYVPGIINLNNDMEFLHAGKLKTSTDNIEYLLKSDDLNFKWITSSDGSKVNNAVYLDDCESLYIARSSDGEKFHIGALSRSIGGVHYINEDGNAVFASDYEILVYDNSAFHVSNPSPCRK